MSDQQTHDEVDREAPTPRITGSLERWKDFAELAQTLFDQASLKAFRCEKVLEEISFRDAGNLRRIARHARKLVEAFELWRDGDPGPDARGAALAKLYALREEARELGVQVNG